MLPNAESKKTEQLKDILVQGCISMNASFGGKASLPPTFIILFTEQPYKQYVSLTENEITHYRQYNTLQTPVQEDLPSLLNFNYCSSFGLDLTLPMCQQEHVSAEPIQLTTPYKNTQTLFGEITFLPA